MAKVVELVIDEENFKDGVFAISLVEEPAIEIDFVALNKMNDPLMLKSIDDEKRLVMGALLVPDFPILRKDKDGNPFYILFKENTIREASQLYMKKGNQSNATIEHSLRVEGATVVETWMKEDETHDKSVKHKIDAPVGSWFVTMKIDNNELWEDYVKTGKVKGFSIEGLFEDQMKVAARKTELSNDNADFYTLLEEAVDFITN